MKKLTSKALVLSYAAFLMLAVTGCSQQQKAAATPQDAIQQSTALQTVDEQAKYLISQANNFLNSKQYDDAITLAKHVLAKLDSNSQEAKSLLEKATAEMKKMAEQKIAETKSDLTNKINSLGK